MATNPYGQRDSVFVIPFANSGIRYGFLTSMTATEQGQLGHKPTAPGTGVNTVGAVFGINAPKPAKMQKITAGKGYQSSFADYTNVATAISSGWKKIRPATFKRAYNTKLTKAVYVDAAALPGTPFKYAWKMPLWQYNAPTVSADKAALGITDCDASVQNYVWGATKHAPPRASFTAQPAAGGASKTYSVFVAWNKIDNLPSGWVAKRQKNSNYI